MARTAKDIMATSFSDAMEIVKKLTDSYSYPPSADGKVIAASNIAIAIFSYEVEMESMKDSHKQVDDDAIDPDDIGFNQQ